MTRLLLPCLLLTGCTIACAPESRDTRCTNTSPEVSLPHLPTCTPEAPPTPEQVSLHTGQCICSRKDRMICYHIDSESMSTSGIRWLTLSYLVAPDIKAYSEYPDALRFYRVIECPR